MAVANRRSRALGPDKHFDYVFHDDHSVECAVAPGSAGRKRNPPCGPRPNADAPWFVLASMQTRLPAHKADRVFASFICRQDCLHHLQSRQRSIGVGLLMTP